MNPRPKLKPKLTTADKAIEILAWFAILAIWALTITNYQDLPNIIPTHYNFAGIADGYGDKWMILTLPLVATVLYIGLTILNKFPHILNYPTEITAENALKQYTIAARLIRYLKLIIVIIFGLIALQNIRNAKGQLSGLGTWFLPLTVGLTIIPILYYLIKSSERKRL